MTGRRRLVVISRAPGWGVCRHRPAAAQASRYVVRVDVPCVVACRRGRIAILSDEDLGRDVRRLARAVAHSLHAFSQNARSLMSSAERSSAPTARSTCGSSPRVAIAPRARCGLARGGLRRRGARSPESWVLPFARQSANAARHREPWNSRTWCRLNTHGWPDAALHVRHGTRIGFPGLMSLSLIHASLSVEKR